jgi:hypothetical protein
MTDAADTGPIREFLRFNGQIILMKYCDRHIILHLFVHTVLRYKIHEALKC